MIASAWSSVIYTHMLSCILALAWPARAAAYSPCHPPHPDFHQSHVAPRTASLAILALVYSDTPGPVTAAEVLSWYTSGVEFITHVSSGCTNLTLVPFVVHLA